MCKYRMTLTLSALFIVSSTAVADKPDDIEYLNSGKVIPTNLPFSEAVRVNDVYYLSGHVGIQPGTLKLVPGGIAAEAKQTMDNIAISLRAHGLSMRNLVKCTVMLADISEWEAFNDVYKLYFDSVFPARSAFGTQGLALGARVEVECIAATGMASTK